MEIAKAYVSVMFKTDEGRKKLESDIKQTGRSVTGRIAQLFGAAAFTVGIKKSIDAASDLNETVSKTKVIFGQSGQAILDWSKGSAEAFGLSRKAALDAASTFATFGKGAGLAGEDLTAFSQKLVGLSSDLASFYNTSPEQAIGAIGAALRGESEPIRQYGVLLDDATLKARALTLGLYDGKGALEQSSRVMAAQAEILAQTTDAQGDFIKTAGGVANSQRIAAAKTADAAASMGANFLPIYQKAVEVVGALADGFGSLPGPVQTAVVALVGIIALSGPIKNVISVSKDLTSAFKNLGTTGKGLATGLGIAGALISAAIIAYQVYSGRKEEATQRTKDLRSALLGEAAAQNEALAALANNDGKVKAFLQTQKDLGVKTEELTQFVKDGTGPVADLTAAWREAQDTTEGTYPGLEKLARLLGIDVSKEGWDVAAASARDFIDEANRIKASNDDMVATQQLVNEVTQTGTGVMKEYASSVRDGSGQVAVAAREAKVSLAGYAESARLTGLAGQELAKAEEAAALATKEHDDAVESINEVLDEQSENFREIASAADELLTALNNLIAPTLDLEQASRDYQAAIDDIIPSLADNGKTLDINTDKGRANREMIDKGIKSIIDYGSAQVGAGKSVDEAGAAVQLMIEDLKNQLTAAGLTREEVEAYIAQLNLTPESITTAVQLANDEVTRQKIAGLIAQMTTLSAGAIAKVQALVDMGQLDLALKALEYIERYDNRSIDIYLNAHNNISPYIDPGKQNNGPATAKPSAADVQKWMDEIAKQNGEFESGGVIGGRPGVRRVIIAHGGETVLPTGMASSDPGGDFLRWYSMYFTAHPDEKAAFDAAYPADGSFPNIRPARDFYTEDRDRIARSYAAADAQPFAPSVPVVPQPAGYESVLGRLYGSLLGYSSSDAPISDGGQGRASNAQGGSMDDVVAALNHANELLQIIADSSVNMIALDDRRVVNTLDRAAERIRKETA